MTARKKTIGEEVLTLPPDRAPNGSPLCALDVEEKPLTFLISGWIPYDSVTLFWGEPGIGKTYFWTKLIGDLTRGRPTLFEMDLLDPVERQPITCLFLSKEDPFDRQLKRRLRQADADLSRVFGYGQESEAILNIDLLSKELERWINEIRPALVVVDALQRFMPPGSDINKAKDVSDVIMKVSHLAAKYHTAFLLIHHNNKTTGSEKGRQEMAGSGDLYASARSVIAAGDTGEKVDEAYRHFILLDKHNYSSPQPAVLYHIDRNGICFDGRSDKTFAQFKSQWRQSQTEQSIYATPRKDEAKAQILDILSYGDETPGNLSKTLKRDFGTSTDTFQRAKRELIEENKLYSYYVGNENRRGRTMYLTLDRTKAYDRNKKR